jgi:CubicO group peptidase (beta-lactamase class C family)
MKAFFSSLTIILALAAHAVVARGQGALTDEQLAARVDSIFSRYARPDAPGCAVSVMKAGKIRYARGYGLADVANGIPMTAATPVSVASTSKQFTALAVLLLESEGKLRLEDDVRRYVPEVPDFGHTITIRMLLNHTSGLRELANLFYFSGWRNWDEQYKSDVFDMIRRQRALNHLPGAEFSYNSSGYTFLAIVVERVSGVSFRKFVIERIFKPLGMAHSDVQEDVDQVISHRATGYWGHDPANLRTARPSYSFNGHGGVVSSVEDLARWDANFYEHRVGTEAVLNQMTTKGRLSDGTEFGYGMGLFIGSHRGFRMVSHAGSDYGYKADFIRFPAEQLTVTVLCNAFDIFPTPLALQVADLYLPATNEPQVSSPAAALPGNSAPENAAAFAGLYWNEAAMQGNRFFYEKGKLVLDGGGEGKFELRPLGNNTYRVMEAPRRFIFSFFTRRDGSPAVRVDVEGSPVRELVKVADTKPTIAALRALEGRYFSPELDVTWTFVVRDGALVLERHRWKPSPLTPVFGNTFQAEGFVLAFRRDPRARTVVLEITTERVRRLQFTRVRGARQGAQR